MPWICLPTADVDRQLRGLVQLFRARDRRDLAGEHPGPLEGDQTMPLDRDDFVEQVLDAWPGVNRDRDEREILGQREEPVGAAVVLQAEALGATEHHADLDLLASVQIEQRVGDELMLGPVALAEIRGELQAVVVHG